MDQPRSLIVPMSPNDLFFTYRPFPPMKAIFLRSAAMISLLTAAAHGQSINWGSEAFSTLVDSRGNTIGQNGYVFELGAFNSGFTPTSNNLMSWFANWRVYDTAEYSSTNGYFTGAVDMLDNGTSGLGGDTFAGLNAYIWIRNSNIGESPTTEWLLVRNSSWQFPTPTSHCCDPSLPVEWSVSDLSSTDLPKYGGQGGTEGLTNTPYSTPGPGLVTERLTSGTFLQTYTFVPELSSSVLILVLGVLGLLDRRRTWSTSSSARQSL